MFNSDFISPVTSIERILPENSSLKLFMKRDDLIHPFISGNKWRKLKYIIQDALGKEKKAWVTFGGAWSNHLLASACAGALFNIKTFAIVRGEENFNNPILSMCKLYGMEIFQVSRSDYRDKDKSLNLFFETILKKNVHLEMADFYTIPEGGSHILALEGCKEIINELPETYDHIFCACGTGTTLAGLSLGLQAKSFNNNSTILHGIPVLADSAYLKKEIENWVKEAKYEWHDSYHFGGYAKKTNELMETVQHFTSQTGILIEPIYTGKVVHAVLDLIKNDYFKPDDKILILHTGGLTGLFGITA